MTTGDGFSRRDFFKSVGTAAGAAGLPAMAATEAFAQAAPSLSGLPDTPVSPFPTLNRRTLGWMRFLWEKSTTRDDWSSNGVPHPWWDRDTAPVVLSYGRFDLSFSAYGIMMMADQTPAGREVYTRMTDQMASRFPTYWGAIDWLTQIGNDPKRAKYPPPVMATLPPNLRGNYNRFGWTGNGVEPWGLQKDPIGADGYLFFRGWFHLLLGTYKYVSGDDKWARPFKVVGYGDEEFEWDHHRLATRLDEQYRQRPEGPHCENTKIWFYCNMAAALGMYLYDKVYNKQTHRSAQNFLEYSRKNYVGVSADGKLEWVTSYYDPIVGFKLNGPAAGTGMSTAFLLAPQNREFASFSLRSRRERGRLPCSECAGAGERGNAPDGARTRRHGRGREAQGRCRSRKRPALLREAERDVRLVDELPDGRLPAWPGERHHDGVRDRSPGRLDPVAAGAVPGQVHRPHRGRRGLPVDGAVSGVERPGQRHAQRRHLCRIAGQARRDHLVQDHQPAEREPRRDYRGRPAVHPLRSDGAERHPHRHDHR